jgi:hypothetical protein
LKKKRVLTAAALAAFLSSAAVGCAGQSTSAVTIATDDGTRR